jgi:hypothetical protein
MEVFQMSVRRVQSVTLAAMAAAILIVTLGVPCSAAKTKPAKPAWMSLPAVKPTGEKQFQGCYTVEDRKSIDWKRPPFVYNEKAATGRKLAKVIVLIYNPILKKHGNVRLTDYYKLNDPIEYSNILVDVIRQASWGYINYQIVDTIVVDGFPTRLDGTRYDEDSYVEARRTQKWYPITSSYRKFFEDNNLVERFKKEGITELWVWGATGFHFDEFAGYIPNRYARFGPTDNAWIYRPYDIPDEIGHTTWVMGFNVDVGPDNMVHSYTHRVESQAVLAFGDGIWDTNNRRDPWNVFSWVEMDHLGTPSMVGNCHVPPNGQGGYDYNNKRLVKSYADNWSNYPDLRGKPRDIGSVEWGNSQFGYQKWILEHLPKFPGCTKYGYNNWWVYVANTDENLPDFKMPDPSNFIVPDDFPKTH